MPEQEPETPPEVDLSPGVPVTPDQSLPAGEKKALWWVLGALIVVQLVGLYSPGTSGIPAPTHVDKVVHAAMFGVPLYVLGRLSRRTWLWAAIFLVHAGLSEIIQYSLVPGRNGDILDFTADVVGIAIALLALRWRRTAA